MDIRDKINKSMVELSEVHNALFLNHATGTGKTKSALDISLTVPGPHLFIHYETTHLDNILAELILFDFDPADFIFTTYAGISRFAGQTFGCIILDECHHLTDLSAGVIRTMKCKKFITLSAEMTTPKFRILKRLAPKIYKHSITIENAVEMGILPKPKVKVHYMDLNNTIKRDYSLSNIKKTTAVKYVKDFKEYSDLMETNAKWTFDIRANLTDQEYYNFIDGIYKSYEDKIIILEDSVEQIEADMKKNPHTQFMYDVNPILQEIEDIKLYKKITGNKRKQFVSECKSSFVTELFNELKGKKLAFVNSIPSANKLSIKHIHSHVKKTQVKKLISEFKSGDIMELVCVNMMKESHNIPKLDHVILQQLDISNVLQFIQVQGRALRSDKTILHLILVRGTIDDNILINLKNKNLIEL